ncbi:MAG: NERD domain-containing protein, partial [Desulfurobacteriaceae bacterium]
STIRKTLKKILKGEKGELEVLKSISSLLEEGDLKDPNFLILNRVVIPDVTGSKEIDLLLLHPVLGIYVIEVKNWDSLEHLVDDNLFKSVREKADILKSYINDNLKTLPINIEHRVVFPSISSKEGEKFFEKHPSFKRYKNHTFFKDDLSSKENFRRFFNSSSSVVPTREQFIDVVKLLGGEKKGIEKIIPILSKGKISFFDYKQLSVLNGYTGGFRIIRGVAGTGKTVILINFIVSRPREKFLVICFNRKLKDAIVRELKKLKRYDKNVYVYSLFEFLKEIGFDFNKFNLSTKSSIEEKYKRFETEEAIQEFRNKLKQYLRSNPISIFLCDETQDMPPGFMRAMLEEIKNCIFFIDEGQKFYPYTMNSVRDIFYHPMFKEEISMRGRVRNLKTIYRTPSNLAKCALEILSLDKTINNYYRKARYIENNLLSDISYVLEEGKIFLGDFNDFDKILEIVEKLPKDKKTYILAYTKKIANSINNLLEKKNISNAKALPLQGVKGLEADNIIIHGFDCFLEKSFEDPKEREILFRKTYVLMTRAREKLFLSIKESSYAKIEKVPELKKIIEILRKYSELYSPEKLIVSFESLEGNNGGNKG